MQIRTIITIWNTLSNLKPAKSTEGKAYVLNVKKALRPTYNEYTDFEKDAYETVKQNSDTIDERALADILAPEQKREVDINLPELTDSVLFEIMEANPDIPFGAYDILIF